MLRIGLLLALAVATLGYSLFDRQYDDLWEKYKISHNKSYYPEEESLRRLIWEKTVRKVAKHNLEADLGLHTYTLEINKFADMTSEEYKAQMTPISFERDLARRMQSTFIAPSHVTLPDEVDWRKEGFVTSVKNQGECNSCWAFSTIGAIEGQHKKKTGELVELSPQHLVDCTVSKQYGKFGCQVGSMYSAYRSLIKNGGGVSTEESYPYTGVAGECKFNESNIGATITGYQRIPAGDENALKAAVATVGPISVAIDSTPEEFRLYKEGIIVSTNCLRLEFSLTHAVLVVGYGTENGQDYWLIKNTLGPDWGEAGYLRLARNRDNMCGIASVASFPLM